MTTQVEMTKLMCWHTHKTAVSISVIVVFVGSNKKIINT